MAAVRAGRMFGRRVSLAAHDPTPSLTVGLLPCSPDLPHCRRSGLGWNPQFVLRCTPMIGRTSLVLSPRSAKYRRTLSWLLLLMIAYGATVEAMHSHGGITPNRSSLAAVSDAGGSQSSNTRRSQHSECSICQLQRQLFNGLVHAPVFARAPLTEIAFVFTLSVFHPSTPTTPTSGRAPPLHQV